MEVELKRPWARHAASVSGHKQSVRHVAVTCIMCHVCYVSPVLGARVASAAC